jgi:hypothetical protein
VRRGGPRLGHLRIRTMSSVYMYDAFGVFRSSLPQKTGVFHPSSRAED